MEKKENGQFKKSKYEDLTGQVFSKLTVHSLSHQDRNRRHIWNCICECNGLSKVASSDLKAKRIKTCGCGHKGDWKGYEDIAGSHWSRMKYDAKNREIEFNITIIEAWELFKKQENLCALSKVPIFFGPRYTIDETTASLDRIDSLKGYIPDNIQWVHKRVNQMKNNMSIIEFKTWCKLIAEVE